MDFQIVLLKLVLTPLLIAAVTLVGRRWGPKVSGLFIGLPLTSGPVSIFLAVEQGPEFAARASEGAILGLGSVAMFCYGYSMAAKQKTWTRSALIGLLFYFCATFVLREISLSLPLSFILICLILSLVLLFFPTPTDAITIIRSPNWDIPVRMLVATSMVLFLTGFARLLGPSLSGLLSPFPVFALILSGFSQTLEGPGAAIRLLRSVVIGTFAFAIFFLVVAVAISRFGLLFTYLSALLSALAVSSVSLLLIQKSSLMKIVSR
ncbi:DUF3147 family protein [bacterium]|nr:DUF3147 family protein [bacterium]